MGILESTDQYTDENGVPVPWMYERHFIDEWNEVAEKLKFRAYVDKNNRFASRKRLGIIIEANAALLGGSKQTNKGVLTRRFYEQFIFACDYLKANHDTDAHGLEVLGKQYQKTMGVWQWLRPDLKAIVFLAGLHLGKDDALAEQEADKDRRRAKAKAMKELAGSWKAIEHKISYLLRDPYKIKMLQPVVTKAMASIEEEIEFLANPPST